MAYDRHNREMLGRINDQCQSLLAKCKKENNRGLTPEERVTFNKLMDSHTELQEKIRQNEGASGVNSSIDITNNLQEYRQDSFRLSPRLQRERAGDDYGRVFESYLRRGINGLEEDERRLVMAGADNRTDFRNTTSTTTGSQGGFTVPTGFSGMLEQAMKWFGGIKGTVTEFETATGNPWPWPTNNDTTNIGRIIGQNQQVIETDPVFGQVTFNAYIFSSDLVLIPLSLLEDSFFDLSAMLAEMLGTRIGRLLNQKCTIGSGTGEPTGIVTAAVAAGNTNVFPNGETASISYNDLVNLQHAVDPAYRENPGSHWMFSDTVLKLLKKLIDGNGRPLWQPGLTASFADGAGVTESKPMILGRPYMINGDMAVPAANANTVLFGDMSRYKLRKVANGISLQRLVERYADYLQVGFISWGRFDGNLIDAGTHPLVVGVQSAV